jgi:hypothetical protein
MEASSQNKRVDARQRWTSEHQQQAEELHAQGLSYRAISRELGFHHNTVRCRLDPAAQEKQLEQKRRHHAANKEEAKKKCREWYWANVEKARQFARDYYWANRDKCRERSDQWRRDNLKQHRESCRRWVARNPEKAKEVARRADQKWREQNPEKVREKAAKYRKANRQKINEKERIRRQQDPKRLREIKRRWREANPSFVCGVRRPWTSGEQRTVEALRAHGMSLELIGRTIGRSATSIAYKLNPEHYRTMRQRWRMQNRERERANAQRWLQINRAKIQERAKLWRQANPEKSREATRKRHAMRRAARRQSIVPLSSDGKAQRFAIFSNRCAYCGRNQSLSVDHVLALNAGGLDEISNIVPACQTCNSSKRASPVEEWYRRQPFFTDSRWQKIQKHCPASTVGQLPLAFDSASAA